MDNNIINPYNPSQAPPPK